MSQSNLCKPVIARSGATKQSRKSRFSVYWIASLRPQRLIVGFIEIAIGGPPAPRIPYK